MAGNISIGSTANFKWQSRTSTRGLIRALHTLDHYLDGVVRGKRANDESIPEIVVGIKTTWFRIVNSAIHNAV